MSLRCIRATTDVIRSDRVVTQWVRRARRHRGQHRRNGYL